MRCACRRTVSTLSAPTCWLLLPPRSTRRLPAGELTALRPLPICQRYLLAVLCCIPTHPASPCMFRATATSPGSPSLAGTVPTSLRAAPGLAALGLSPRVADPSWYQSLLAAAHNASPTRHSPAGHHAGGHTASHAAHGGGAHAPSHKKEHKKDKKESGEGKGSSSSSSSASSPEGKAAGSAGHHGGAHGGSHGAASHGASRGAHGHTSVDEITRAAREVALQVRASPV